MRYGVFKKLLTAGLTALCITAVTSPSYAAVTQMLNDTFYGNPAELAFVKSTRATLGFMVINPRAEYKGTAGGMRGSDTSSPVRWFPYGMVAKRLSERVVVGLNFSPSGYGQVDWGRGSNFLATSTTRTDVTHYAIKSTMSIKITDSFDVGLGLGFVHGYEVINNFVPGMGELRNKEEHFDFLWNVGFLYKLNQTNFVGGSFYAPLPHNGEGTSEIGKAKSHNYSLRTISAAVASLSYIRIWNPKLITKARVYYSAWSGQKKFIFKNTLLGTFTQPLNWNDTWSFQLSSRYAFTPEYAALASITYETSAANAGTNLAGYPLSDFIGFNLGLDAKFTKTLSTQLIYGYGRFLSKAKINDVARGNRGDISMDVNALLLQLTYDV